MTLRVPFPEIKDVLIQKLPYKIMWMDEIGRIVYGNEQFCKRLGYKASEITKLSVFDINPSTTDESWIKHWNEVKEKSTVNFKSVHQTKEGKFYDVEVFAQFFSNNGKEIICAIVNDISASSFYRNILDSSEKMNRIGGWKLNLQDGSIIVTKQALKLFETDNAQSFLPGQVINRFEESETLKALLSNVIRDGVSFDITLKVKMDDAQPKYLRCVTSAKVKNKKVYKLIGTYQDVTDNIIRSKELENALQELSKLKAELETDNQYLREEINSKINFDNIICQSEAYRKVLEMVTQVAITDATVLITGESGTGKELLANAVHLNSSRKERTLIKVNCATLPKELIESELFGHKKGAFTGAVSDKIGKFNLADRGTIFLDEIGEIPLDLQSKLLRVLQEGEFDQLGATKTTKVDVRVVAATNRNLQSMVKNGSFRQDLYYRLNVFPIENIPLRTRKEDIPLLAQFFLEKYSAKAGKAFKRLSKKTITKLMDYNFPGNIRELENLIERAVIVENGTTLQPGSWLPSENGKIDSEEFKTIDVLQRDYIIKVLEHTNWRVSGSKGAAVILGIKDKTLFARMKKLGIEKQVSLKK